MMSRTPRAKTIPAFARQTDMRSNSGQFRPFAAGTIGMTISGTFQFGETCLDLIQGCIPVRGTTERTNSDSKASLANITMDTNALVFDANFSGRVKKSPLTLISCYLLACGNDLKNFVQNIFQRSSAKEGRIQNRSYFNAGAERAFYPKCKMRMALKNWHAAGNSIEGQRCRFYRGFFGC